MPNIASAKKRVRQTEKRTARNKSRLSRVRTFVRRVEEALRAGDAGAARAALAAAEPEIMRGATKGVMHRRQASRKVSRLTLRLKKLEA